MRAFGSNWLFSYSWLLLGCVSCWLPLAAPGSWLLLATHGSSWPPPWLLLPAPLDFYEKNTFKLLSKMLHFWYSEMTSGRIWLQLIIWLPLAAGCPWLLLRTPDCSLLLLAAVNLSKKIGIAMLRVLGWWVFHNQCIPS